MNRGTFAKNVVRVMTSRGIMLVSEILLGFLVPKILGVTGYGYLKTYSLYTAYSALLHFGFVDGVLLHFAGKEYEQLDKQRMRAYSRFYIYLEFLVAILLLTICSVILPDNLRFIGFMLAVNTFVINLTSYYQFISQATQRFAELSLRNILTAVCKILLVAGMVMIYQRYGNYISYRWYIILLNVIEGALLLWYVLTYRDITFGKSIPIKICRKEINHFFKNGIMLTIAYQVAHIVLILDRQFVSVLYSADVFAIYSFAYSLVAVCTKVISSLSTVLFPMLRQMKEKAAIQYFSTAISIMMIVSGGVLTGYYPIRWFVGWFLPAYVDSLEYLKVILPALMLNCCISVIIFTFYKVLNKNEVYFRFSCLALAISFGLNMTAYILFDSPTAISWASVISMLFWYLLSQSYFVKIYQVEWKRNLGYVVAVIVMFYLTCFGVQNDWQGMLLYGIGYLILTVLFYRNTALISYVRAKK